MKSIRMIHDQSLGINAGVIFVGAMLTFAFAACAGLFPWGERDTFIRVRGTQFIHNDRPYYFAGTNLWHGCYLGSPGSTGDRGRLLRELDSLQANGLVNLRVLAASEESYITWSVKPAIQRSPGILDDSLLQGLDFLMAAMADRKMHAVLYLNNYWEWSGGMSQYNDWADGGGGVDPADTTKGYRGFMEYSAKFYSHQKANEMFRTYVRTIVGRRNTANGRLYSEDPTIMSWQLANEPRPSTSSTDEDRNLESFYRWIDQTAAYIHSLDTNHLVSTGSEGAVGFRWSNEYALKTHQSRSIDYVTFHVWPKNWGWFEPTRYEETLPASEKNALAYVQAHIGIARQVGKPIVMEEFGLARDSARCKPGSPTTARDRYLDTILTAVYDSARAGAPFAGWNFWTWGGEGKAIHADDVWRKGDPFLGDPPQEPQGYNSVFLADTSTMRILRYQAFNLMRLGTVDSLYVSNVP